MPQFVVAHFVSLSCMVRYSIQSTADWLAYTTLAIFLSHFKSFCTHFQLPTLPRISLSTHSDSSTMSVLYKSCTYLLTFGHLKKYFYVYLCCNYVLLLEHNWEMTSTIVPWMCVWCRQLCDEGGGVPRHEIDKLFQYMYSTAPHPPSPDVVKTAPLVSWTMNNNNNNISGLSS